jgi:hypothetical protein
VKNVGTKKINTISSSDIILQTPSSVASVPYVSGCTSECWDYSLE